MEFERMSRKKILLSWPLKLLESIPERLQEGIETKKEDLSLRKVVNLVNAAEFDTSWQIHRFLGQGG